MNGFQKMRQVIEQTRVVRFPRHRLSTFGDSEIQYNLVTPESSAPARSTLRTGRVTAEKPKILTPETLLRRFEGFGEDADGFERLLKDHFQDSFRGLEYVFRNRLDSVTSHERDAGDLASSIRRDLEDRAALRAAVICGPESGWQLALMKFMLEETGRSFPVNMRELDERGLFEPGQAAVNRQRREIETLFQRARQDPDALKVLGRRLKDEGLFEEYQDRFFQLVRP